MDTKQTDMITVTNNNVDSFIVHLTKTVKRHTKDTEQIVAYNNADTEGKKLIKGHLIPFVVKFSAPLSAVINKAVSTIVIDNRAKLNKSPNYLSNLKELNISWDGTTERVRTKLSAPDQGIKSYDECEGMDKTIFLKHILADKSLTDEQKALIKNL